MVAEDQRAGPFGPAQARAASTLASALSSVVLMLSSCWSTAASAGIGVTNSAFSALAGRSWALLALSTADANAASN